MTEFLWFADWSVTMPDWPVTFPDGIA